MFEKGYYFAIKKIRELANECGVLFPEVTSKNYRYGKTEKCCSWTEGFWTGMLWLAYEKTADKIFMTTANELVDRLEKRLYEREELNHHDLGFLYSLSSVAEYKLFGHEKSLKAGIEAADVLMQRYHENGKFIQAWGDMNDKDSYRLIIDCLMNIPLLYWAAEVTGNSHYSDTATNHLHTAIDCVIRKDYTTYHTYYFDAETGAKLRGVTAQGYSNDSCWARGQAWGIYGLALAYAYTGEKNLIDLYTKVTDCFISKLPSDFVPYWDMIFTEGDEPRDTSAAAIAACGILEMNRHVKNEQHMGICLQMMKSLEDHYLTGENSNAILSDGMYSRPAGDEPEASMWGDYFYMEALTRINNPDWDMYW